MMSHDLARQLAYHLSRSNDFHAAGRYPEAIAELQLVFKQAPDSPEAHFNMGNVLRDSGNLELAVEGFANAIRAAAAAGRAYPEALLNLGDVFLRLNRNQDAIQALQDAVAAAPHMPEVHMGLGLAHYALRDYAAAMQAYGNALKINPGHIGVLNNFALTQYRAGDPKAALQTYDRLVGLAPDFADGRLHRALIALLMGDYQSGFRDYEYRWQLPFFKDMRLKTPAPEWQGEDLTGRTIITYGEQGYGDVFQFVRYVPLLARLGAHVLVITNPALRSLMLGVEGTTGVLMPGDALPEHDFVIPILSLPTRFGTVPATIPAQVPYIKVPQDKIDYWRGRLSDLHARLKIGIVWAGRPEHPFDDTRSMPLATLAPLGRIHDVAYVSLQQGARADEPGLDMWRPGPLIDFSDTAGIIQALDMVIGVDTSVIHLAGALARKTCVMIAAVPEWRWGLKGEITPWYPTVKVLRQTEPGDWSNVVQSLGSEIMKMLAG